MRMKTLPPSQRRALRAKAHALHPFVAIGQHGLTPAVLHEIDVALLAHELIKIRVFSDTRDDREGMLARICTQLDAAPVQHIGKLLVLWRQAPAPEPVQVATTPARTRAKAPRTPPKTAGKKPRGNARTMVTTGAKRTPRAGTAKPTARKNRGAPRGATAASFAEEPGTRRRNRGAEPDERRGVARPA
ncbi:MAG: YhbY family RNA-binding protein, partial [Aromatoleum sp.]|nr:YhbY family RNA-binding protein [Aromatoleum sp.]